MGLEENRVYYQHELWCTTDNWAPEETNGMRTCLDCAGVFDKDGKGVCVTSKKFDSFID